MGPLLDKSPDDGERLDVYLARASHRARNQAQEAIRKGCVQVNGTITTRPGAKLRPSDTIQAEFPPPEPMEALPEDIPLDVIFEDESFIVIDKPAGMVVHPAAGHPGGTLVNALLGRVGSLPGPDPFRPGIVHRLDKDTSGLLVVAKTPAARENLMQQLKVRSMSRRYLALSDRAPSPSEGTVELPVARHPTHRKRMAVVLGGREAVTRYRMIRLFASGKALLDLSLGTGRTHQIRVHLAHLGSPVTGDLLYGKGREGERQLLHAYRLKLTHPVTGLEMTFRSALPQDFRERLKKEDPLLSDPEIDALVEESAGREPA